MLNDLAYTIVYVDDMDKSTAFYRDTLGLPLDSATSGWTQFKSNGAAVVLHPRLKGTDGAAGNAVRLAFRVDDLDQVYRDLSTRSVKFLAPPAVAAFGKHAVLLDPEGNQIDLIEWSGQDTMRVSGDTIVNEILAKSPHAMEVLEEHGIRICGGCIVLLNGSVRETAQYSGLSDAEAAEMVNELAKIQEEGSEGA